MRLDLFASTLAQQVLAIASEEGICWYREQHPGKGDPDFEDDLKALQQRCRSLPRSKAWKESISRLVPGSRKGIVLNTLERRDVGTTTLRLRIATNPEIAYLMIEWMLMPDSDKGGSLREKISNTIRRIFIQEITLDPQESLNLAMIISRIINHLEQVAVNDEKIADIRRKLHEEKHPTEEHSPGNVIFERLGVPAPLVEAPPHPGRASNIERDPHLDFVGRDKELGQLRDFLSSDTTPIAIVPAEGCPNMGLGATTLAIECACRWRGELFPGGTYLVNAENEELLQNQLAAMTGLWGKSWDLFDTDAERVEFTFSALSTGELSLLILDNVNDKNLHDVMSGLSSTSSCRVLATTRQRTLQGSRAVSLGGLDPESALRLLVGKEHLNVSGKERAAAKQVCETYGYIPLALELAAGYLRGKRYSESFSDYLQKIQTKCTPRYIGKKRQDLKTIFNHMVTDTEFYLYCAFKTNFDMILQIPEAFALVQAAAMFQEGYSINPKLLRHAAGLETMDKKALLRVIGLMIGSNTLKVKKPEDHRPKFVYLHSLLSRFLRVMYLSHLPQRRAGIETRFVTAINDFLNQTPSDMHSYILHTYRELPHIFKASNLLTRTDLDDPAIERRLCFNLSRLYHLKGEYEKAHYYLQKSERITRQKCRGESVFMASIFNSLGVLQHATSPDSAFTMCLRSYTLLEDLFEHEHPYPANVLFNIAYICRERGEVENAEKYYKKALSIFEKMYGNNHRTVAETLYELAQIRKSKGDLYTSLNYLNRCLVIEKAMNGTRHPAIARCLQALGDILMMRGNLDDALDYYQQTLQIEKSLYGSDHPLIANRLSMIAWALQLQDDMDKALEYLHTALQIYQKQLTGNQTRAQDTMNLIAALHKNRGEWDEALEYYKRILLLQKQDHGERHTYTAATLKDISDILTKKGNMSGAISCMQRALRIESVVFGDEHLEMAEDMVKLATLYQHAGEFDEALDYMKRALPVFEKHFGNSHPRVSTLVNNIGTLLWEKGKPADALQWLSRALDIDKHHLPPDHVELATAMNNIGAMQLEQGDTHIALDNFKEALRILEINYGKFHPLVAAGLNNIAAVFQECGEWEDALNYLQRALDIDEKTLGRKHPDVASDLNNIGLVYLEKAEAAKALDCFSKSIGILESSYSSDHPRISSVMMNMARTLWKKGDLEQAYMYFKRGLKIDIKALGKNHVRVADDLCTIADIQDARGKGKVSDCLRRRAHTISTPK